MECSVCSVCYDNIKRSCITCHDLCNKCYNKIENKICPICRQKMIQVVYSNIISIEYIKKDCIGFKFIQMKNLKKYVFSNEFKELLKMRLKRQTENIYYTRKYVMIQGCRYDYEELLPLNNQNKYQPIFYKLLGYISNPYWLMNILCRLKRGEQIEINDIFTIRNVLNSGYDDGIVTTKEILREFWDKFKYNYGY